MQQTSSPVQAGGVRVLKLGEKASSGGIPLATSTSTVRGPIKKGPIPLSTTTTPSTNAPSPAVKAKGWDWDDWGDVEKDE